MENENKNKNLLKFALIMSAIVASLLLSGIVGMELALMGSGKSFADVFKSATSGESTIAAKNVTSDVAGEESDVDADEGKKAISEYIEETTRKMNENAEKELSDKKPSDKTEKSSEKDVKSDKTADKKDKADKSGNEDPVSKDKKAEKVELPNKEEILKKKIEMESMNPEDEQPDITDDVTEVPDTAEESIAETQESVPVSDIPEELNYDPSVYADPNLNYPGLFTTVDESYFEDALFIGDSRLQGFGLWSNLPATFYCATGFQLYKYETAKVVQTENGKVPIFDAIPFNAFTKIYIKVGLNEMGWGSEGMFQEKYAELIAKLRQYEPRAIIYIHGILPVTAAKSAEGGSHNNVNIAARNAELAQFAISQNAYYLDAGTSVMDETGCLGANMASDGVHLKSQYIQMWKQYLMEHAVVVP